MKKNRGAGNRGGRGMAGSGKRADQIKSKILKTKGKRYYGKYGFKRPQSVTKTPKIINLSKIDLLAKKEKEGYVFDASNFDKVLGTGNITKPIKITAKSYSALAKEKIEKAGGEAITC